MYTYKLTWPSGVEVTGKAKKIIDIIKKYDLAGRLNKDVKIETEYTED